MTNRMKALSKLHAREGLWAITEPVPEIGPDDVLTQIKKTCICCTDVYIWNWDDWAASTIPVPMITGHEFAGEIVDLGRNFDRSDTWPALHGRSTSSARHRGRAVQASSTMIPPDAALA